MGRPYKGMNTSLDLRTKRLNKKKRARFSITEITKQDSRDFLKKFDNSPYIGYKIKQVHNEPTEAYFFLIKKITKPIKSERHVVLYTKRVKSGINKTFGHVNFF